MSSAVARKSHRTAPILLILGAAGLLVGTTLHPQGADPAQPLLAFAEYAADGFWIYSHLIQLAGVVAMFLGLILVARKMDQPLAAIISALAMVNIALAAVLQSVDGVALKLLVDRWAGATDPDRDLAFSAAIAARQVEIGLAAMFSLLGGITVAIFSIGLRDGLLFPKWTAALGTIGGVATFAAGLIMAKSGFSPVQMAVGMPASILLLIWVTALGIVEWRRPG